MNRFPFRVASNTPKERTRAMRLAWGLAARRAKRIKKIREVRDRNRMIRAMEQVASEPGSNWTLVKP